MNSRLQVRCEMVNLSPGSSEVRYLAVSWIFRFFMNQISLTLHPQSADIKNGYRCRESRTNGDLVFKLRRVKDTPNFISSGSKIVKRLRRRQYDPVIIERTIGLVLGPCTALYRPFLKHCTLMNKAVGTI